MIDTIDPADEFQVLAHREILVEAEALRHITYLTLDLVGFGADVVVEAGSSPLIRGQQPAQHTDGGRLARSIGTEKAEDRATLDLHGEISNDRTTVEFLRQSVDINDDVLRVHFPDSCGKVTVTGWPTRNFSGCSGRASIRKTNLARSS